MKQTPARPSGNAGALAEVGTHAPLGLARLHVGVEAVALDGDVLVEPRSLQAGEHEVRSHGLAGFFGEPLLGLEPPQAVAGSELPRGPTVHFQEPVAVPHLERGDEPLLQLRLEHRRHVGR